MSNKEIIAKIKAEIERISSRAMNEEGQDLCEYLLSFLSSIEKSLPAKSRDNDGLSGEIKSFTEELECGAKNLYCLMFGKEGNFDKFSWKDTEAIIKDTAHYFYDLGCRRTAEKYDEIEYNRQRAEESVPKDLEEAADSHIRKVADTAGHPGWDWTTQDIAEAFIAGAKWQEEQMMKDGNVILAEEEFDAEKEKSMERGYNLCKEQMMKEAVDTVVSLDAGGFPFIEFGVGKFGLKVGDKIRVIILPKED